VLLRKSIMPTFERCPAEAIPANAVIVNIWRSMGRTVADVACTACPEADDYLVADFPRPVPLALQRAAEVCAYCGLSRVVVVLADETLWNDKWGQLRHPMHMLH
jgi:hypothetical protein